MNDPKAGTLVWDAWAVKVGGVLCYPLADKSAAVNHCARHYSGVGEVVPVRVSMVELPPDADRRGGS